VNGLPTPLSVVLAVPFLLLSTTALVFMYAVRLLGRERGYLAGFLFYWLIWCLLIPLLLLGKKDFLALLVDSFPIFSSATWLAAASWIVITLVTLFMYGKDFVRAPVTLILIAIPVAVLNGFCEELLWRGLYVRVFPENIWLAILYPSVGFALWHLVPLSIFFEGNKYSFVLSTFFLGMVYGYIAYETGSAKWTAISHSLNGMLALGGMIASSIMKLLSW
jgi:membrane protease YdiL (CAAX protease family)